MGNRIIQSRARNSPLQLADCLRSIFLLELLAPSRYIYLVSPWIGDFPIIDNQFGQFRAMMPENGRRVVMFSTVLTMLSERGASVRIIRGPDPIPTDDLLRKLPGTIEVRVAERLHWKGLVTEHAYLRGSMNFTYSGVNLNDESVELTTDAESVAYAMAEAQLSWENATP